MKEVLFYLGLGSNLGERERFLLEALNRLHFAGKICITRWSSIYETEPVGNVEQGPFLNMVVEGKTALSVEQLLHKVLEVERHGGRIRNVRWGPRTIDIDILLYDHISLKTENLTVPHPRLTERAFVLIPLAEIAPDLVLQGAHKTVKTWSEEVGGAGVRKWKKMFKLGANGFELCLNDDVD